MFFVLARRPKYLTQIGRNLSRPTKFSLKDVRCDRPNRTQSSHGDHPMAGQMVTTLTLRARKFSLDRYG